LCASAPELEDVVEERCAAVHLDYPFLEPAHQVAWLRRMLDSDQVRGTLRMD